MTTGVLPLDEQDDPELFADTDCALCSTIQFRKGNQKVVHPSSSELLPGVEPDLPY